MPEPEGPRMATNSLSRKDRLTLSSATCVNDCVTYLLQMPLSSSMDGNLSCTGALARSPPPFVFDAFVLLYPHFSPTPVRNVGNRIKKRTGRRPKKRPQVGPLYGGDYLERQQTTPHSDTRSSRCFTCFLLLAIRNRLVDKLVECCALLGGADGSHDWISYDVAILIDDIRCREREQI